MPTRAFLNSHTKTRRDNRRTIRLAYRGRSGERWTYSPTIVASGPGQLEVSMLVPLAIGHRVEIETDGQASGAATFPPRVRAQVTACQCSPDGLFRIRLSLAEA
jgi:hypothetical protein